MMQVQLPDGSQREVPNDATVADVAASIGKRLSKDAIAGKVNGKVVDVYSKVPDNAKTETVTPKSDAGLDTIRHSTAHLMAMAVQELFPGTQVTIGPVTENGFFYDFGADPQLSDEALRRIDEKMQDIAKRDHRKLGKELGICMCSQFAPSMPIFLPKGAVIYNELVDFIREYYRRENYSEVIAPIIFDTELFKISGHYENYKDNMFFSEIEEREYGVKPMNCPGHTQIFASERRSYRDLPIRLAEFTRLHRYERSGVTHGLTRVRSFAQDDAHLFVTPDQLEPEIDRELHLI